MRLFTNGSIISKLVQGACRRHNVFGNDIEDYTSDTMVKLMENDCKALRDFNDDGTANVTTYLTSVVTNKMIDLLRHEQVIVRWRPSTRAHELGPEVEMLEKFVYHKGYTFTEAYNLLSANKRITMTMEAARDVFESLNTKETKPVYVERDTEIADSRATPEESLLNAERNSINSRLSAIVSDLRSKLPAKDRLLLSLVYDEGIKVSVAARQLSISRQEADKRLSSIITGLKRELLRQGVNFTEVKYIMKENI